MRGVLEGRRRQADADASALGSNCLPHCLPLRVFSDRKIAEVIVAQRKPQKVSDIPPKADICSAQADVRFVPKADIGVGTWCDYR